MPDPQFSRLAESAAADSEHAVPFNFPVSWSSLIDPDALTAKNQALVPTPPPRSPDDPTLQWSMVVPRMQHGSAAVLALPAPGSTARFPFPRYVAPKFEVSLHSGSIAVKMILLAAAAMLLVPGWRDVASPGARAVQLESGIEQRNWIRAGETLVLYRPSVGKSDYQLDFDWKVNPKGIAWVVRAKDSGNYYALRLKPSGSESSRTFTLERITMLRGAERSHTSRIVRFSKPDVQIRMDVAGSTFKLAIDGAAVSQWNDTRLAAGAFGFIEQPRGPLQIASLRVSSLQ